jgi:hypothetical protein
MKIIITESQQESLKNKLEQIVKRSGWEKASKTVGGVDNLLKIGFNNDPMNFLNLFNNLDIVQSEEKPHWTLYRDEKGNDIMAYDRILKVVYINYYEIWYILNFEFKLKKIYLENLIEKWLSKTYNLKKVTILIPLYTN